MNDLQNLKISITGKLESMTRVQAKKYLEKNGAKYINEVNKDTDILVIGALGWPLRINGKITKKLELADSLQKNGEHVQIFPELQFLNRFSKEGPFQFNQFYTTSQLTKILKTPLIKIKDWVLRGLIEPRKSIHRMNWFSYNDLLKVKTIMRLSENGVSCHEIQQSIKRLSQWIPNIDENIKLLEAARGSLQLRTKEGEIISSQGQMIFNFDEVIPEIRSKVDFSKELQKQNLESSPKETMLKTDKAPKNITEKVEYDRRPISIQVKTHLWFDKALSAEEEGDLATAQNYYENATKGDDSNPVAFFNLGNIYYNQGNIANAADQYLRAVQGDPNYIEAWNNLGNSLIDLELPKEARRAFEKALSVEPKYADAHYNLANLLFDLGELQKSRHHYGVYLKKDSISPLAQKVKKQLKIIASRLR